MSDGVNLAHIQELSKKLQYDLPAPFHDSLVESFTSCAVVRLYHIWFPLYIGSLVQSSPPSPDDNSLWSLLTMSGLTHDDLRRIFATLDVDGDGLLTAEELGLLLDKVGGTASTGDVEAVMGVPEGMDLKEFICFYESFLCAGSNSDESELLAAFKVFDLNDDGFISSSELQSVLSSVGLWEEAHGGDCASMIRKFDTNSDGRLDFQEFKNMMLISIAC